MKQTEKQVDKYLCAQVNKAGGLCIKLVTTHFAGLPDRLLLMPGGLAVFAEIKGEGLKLRKLQVYVCSELTRRGFRVELIDTKEKALKLVTELQNTQKI